MTRYIKKRLAEARIAYIRIRKEDKELDLLVRKILKAEFKKIDSMSNQDAINHLDSIQDLFPPVYSKMFLYKRLGELIKNEK